MNLSLREIAEMVGGELESLGSRDNVAAISTDTRTLEPGSLFIPLRGPNFDGHDYLQAAVNQGAVACLSDKRVSGLNAPVIRVADSLVALGDLAAGCRRRFSGSVVAITGSTGKTTTKEMLASILEETGPGLKTEGNFNNLVGLPLTLFRLEKDHRWAVLELGMSARREIGRLAEIAMPDVGVITNIGPAHLETLHGLEGVARAKGELFATLRAGSTAVINADDQLVAGLPVANGVRRLLYGISADAEIRGEEIRADQMSVSFKLLLAQTTWSVSLPVAGRHNVSNALAAAAAAVALGVEEQHIVRGLESFRPAPGRMEIVRLPGDVLLIEDSYNANPLSLRVALEALDELGKGGRRIAVVGDMLELGEAAAGFHREAGWVAARCTDYLLIMGKMAQHIAAGARERGMTAERVLVAADHREVADQLGRLLLPGDRVLIKGSRGMRMERIVAALRCKGEPLVANHR